MAFLVISILLRNQQSSKIKVSALSLLLPLPGYFLSTRLVKKRSNIVQRIKIAEPETNEWDMTERTNSSMTTIRPPEILPPATSWIGAATRLVARPAVQARNATQNESSSNETPGTITVKKPTSERDMLIAEAAKLRQSIVRQQNELIFLERKIACCDANGNAPTSMMGSDNNNKSGNLVLNGISYSLVSTSSFATNLVGGLLKTFQASSNVFLRKIDRVQKRVGKNNQKWEGRVGAYLSHELSAGFRIASKLASEPKQIQQIVTDPRAPTLVPHAPAILARLDRLETHVRPIIEGVLNDRQHLASIEPYLDEILERFDDIEPHLPWILDNIDALAPYTGLLLKHIDALLLYADADDCFAADGGSNDDRYSLADQLLPFLEYYVSKLDIIGPHLVLLRPHVPLLLKDNRIAKVSPHIDKLFAKGYGTKLAASANIDVLLFWFGWTLKIPFAPALFFALPFSPWLVDVLANRLPKKFARRGKTYCRNLECAIDDDYGGSWNKLDKA